MSRRIVLSSYHSNENWYFDYHTLLLKFSGAGDYAPTRDEIAQCIQDSITQYNKQNPEEAPVKCVVDVALMCNQGGCIGQACVWLSNSAVYHMLRGCNPDGKPRIILTEAEEPLVSMTPSSTSSWGDLPSPLSFSTNSLGLSTSAPPSSSPSPAPAPKSEESTKAATMGAALGSSSNIVDERSLITSSAPLDTDSWADLSEAENPTPPKSRTMKISVALDPLMTLDPITRTPAQMEAFKTAKGYYPEDNLLRFEVDIAGVSKDLVNDSGRKKCLSILTGTVPDWVTATALKTAFRQYVSDPLTSHPHNDGRRIIDEPYPQVRLHSFYDKENQRKAQKAFVIFDPCTLDGAFTALISKDFLVTQGTQQTYCYFAFANYGYHREMVGAVEYPCALKGSKGHGSTHSRPAARANGRWGHEANSSTTANGSNDRHQNAWGAKGRQTGPSTDMGTTSNSFDALSLEE